MMKHTIVFLVSSISLTSAQDLRSSWERIQAEFLGGQHDSVVARMPAFLDLLVERNLLSQLSVAQFHYAVSLAHIGKEVESDTAFTRARRYAVGAGEESKVAEIAAKQIQLYMGLARQAEKSNPLGALKHYEKALAVLGPSGEQKSRGILLYQIGLLKRHSGDSHGAVAAFEASLAVVERLPGEGTLVRTLATLLTELYINAGQSARAEALSRRLGSDQARVEYTLKLAEEAEGRGEIAEADRLLASVQPGIIAAGEEARLIEFAKKRYALSEALGQSLRAYDTLLVLLRQAKTSGPGARFHIARLVALLAVQNGNVEEAGNLLGDMRALAATPQLLAYLDQTSGDIAYLQGKNTEAIAAYRKAMAAGGLDEPSRLSMMNNLGLALTRNGDNQEALRVFELLSESSASMPSFRIQADLNAGIVFMKMDEAAAALERFTRARQQAVARQDIALQVMASLRLAEAYRRTGLETSAETLFEEVRRDQALLTNPFNRIQVLQALATNAQATGNKFTALLNLRQAYQLAAESGASGFLAPLAVDLGDTYFLVDSLDAALKFYDTALSFYSATGDLRATVELRYKKGQCLLAQSKYSEARSEANRGVASLESRPGSQESDLLGLGLATRAFIDFTEGKSNNDIRKLLSAMEEIGKAVAVMERRIGGVVGQSQLEAQSLRNVNAFRLYVDIAARLYEATADPRYFELAFNTSEKSRAEAFVTDIGTQLITKLNDPSVKDLAVVTEQLLEHRSREGALAVDIASGNQTRGMTTVGGDEQTIRKYDTIVQKLSAENNKAAQLVSVNTLTLHSVRGLLRDHDVILNYYVSLENAYLFLVTKSTQMMHTIAWKPEDLAATVEAYRSAVHELTRADYLLFARQLYDSLIAPVASNIEGKTVIVVPSGRLNNLPFGGLHSGSGYLVETNDIVVVPNASTLQFVLTGKRLPPSPSVLAIGNPLNPKVTRLPGSEEEVKSIQNIHLRSLVYVGKDASETNSRAQMGGFDIVHLACHGLFNYDYPYLSSLALSPDGRNDGFLEVHELYNLNLTKTNLVILSACETGLAKIRKNDDVIGLVRGFLYAGVPSMAASLWKVDDFATAALMTQFHVLLKLGNTKSEALRKAQLQLLRTDNTRHPYYWAAFVMYGSAN